MSFPAAFPTPRGLVQNASGDIVRVGRSDENGELVLLPRLWDFELESSRPADTTHDATVLTLQSSRGMSARVLCHGDTTQVALLSIPPAA